MINAVDYTIAIQRGVYDGELCFSARVKELPDLVEYGDTYEEAYDLAIGAIEATYEALSQIGRAMPLPMPSIDQYSGRVTLRLPKSLHRELAHQALDEGVSLNQHLVNALSYTAGRQSGAITTDH